MPDEKVDLKFSSLVKKMKAYPSAAAAKGPSEGWARSIRKVLGISQAQLGARISVSRQSVQDLERAEMQRRITLDSLDRLARAMGCRVVLALVPESGSLSDLRRREAGASAAMPYKTSVRARKSAVQQTPARLSVSAAPVSVPALQSPQAEYAVRPVKLRIPTGKLTELCRKYQVKKLSLFGSAARNELTPRSDIDLMIEFEPQARVTLFDFPVLQEELSALFGGRKVDLATPEILENPFRRKTILPTLTTLYAA